MRSERVVKVLEGKMTRRDIEQMMAVADTSKDGRIDYQGFCFITNRTPSSSAVQPSALFSVKTRFSHKSISRRRA